MRTYFLFIQHKSLEIICSPGVAFLSWFDNGNCFKDSGLTDSRSFETNQQHIYRGSSFNVEWMRGTFVCDNSLSPSTGGLLLVRIQLENPK